MKNSPTSQHKDWHDRWQSGRIGFHQSDFHPSLLTYWPDFSLQKNSAVLVPLCGKTLDMIWLAEQCHAVIGVELSEIAAKDFFTENSISYDISTAGQFKKYQGGGITILVGDFFDLTSADIPNVKAVYDRAAIIALPVEMRQKYVRHLQSILVEDSQILLITLAYDQSQMDGPPFSVTSDEVENAFGSWCDITELDTSSPEDFRGIEAVECVYGMRVKNELCRVD